jgi:threonine dehydrogenase-like Zn-dependent dehydrogenase
MDIRQASTHISAGASRGIAKMDGTGKLSNKIAVITGGTTGIGAATATCFQAEGARVIVTGPNPTTLQVAQESNRISPAADWHWHFLAFTWRVA